MTRRDLVKKLLEDNPKGVTTSQFLRAGCGSRYGARVQELRDQGHNISCTCVRAGEFLYVLNSSEPLSWSWHKLGGWKLLPLSVAIRRSQVEQQRVAA